MSAYLQVEVPRPWQAVPANDQSWLHMVVACDSNLPCAISIPAIRHRHRDQVDLDLSMVPGDLRLHPGEVCTLTIGFRCRRAGLSDLSDIVIQANPHEGPANLENQLVKLPAHRFRIVPSLTADLRVTASRICQYDNASKVEVVIVHRGIYELRDVEWTIGPADQVLSGVTRRRIAVMSGPSELRYEMVIAGKQIEIDLNATCQGEPVSSRQTVAIPDTSEQVEERRKFRFLEPRNFTNDTVTIKYEKEIEEVVARGGVFPVYGGKTRYDVIILPKNPNAVDVKLLPAPGQVEVSAAARSARAWPFVITVVENPIFRQAVRLDYIVMVDGQPFQGEIYLAIRPTNSKLWAVAITAGLALTARGMAAVLPAVMRAEEGSLGMFEHIEALVHKKWTDLLQLLAVPLIRGGLWVADVIMRQFDDV